LLRTIVVRRGADDYVFVLVPGGGGLIGRSSVAHLGVRRISLPDKDEALAATGYERGAITPFGSSHAWPVIADTTRRRGRRPRRDRRRAHGVNLHVASADLVRATAATVADVTEPTEPERLGPPLRREQEDRRGGDRQRDRDEHEQLRRAADLQLRRQLRPSCS
jgi:hypothetical protein